MSRISARFRQAPEEVRRYILDYTLSLSSGETVASMATPVVSIVTAPSTDTPVVITNLSVAPGGTQVLFYASQGLATGIYQVQFLATTSAAQVIEDVVEFTIQSDLIS